MGAETNRAAIFAALAQGLDLQDVLTRFRLTRAELQDLFKEVASHYQRLEQNLWRLYSDGAARGNPGPAGAGVILYNHQGEIVAQAGQYLGETTNNVAEYQALIMGLKHARQLGAKRIQVFADSELMVRQLTGRYQVKSPRLLPLWLLAKEELQKFESYAISHVPREENAQADALANQAIDQKSSSR